MPVFPRGFCGPLLTSTVRGRNYHPRDSLHKVENFYPEEERRGPNCNSHKSIGNDWGAAMSTERTMVKVVPLPTSLSCAEPTTFVPATLPVQAPALPS